MAICKAPEGLLCLFLLERSVYGAFSTAQKVSVQNEVP